MTEKEITENISSRLGIKTLNPMQVSVMAAAPKHTILIAPTGSGKTLAFASAMLRSLTAPTGALQGLVIAPSRELTLQTYSVIRPIATGYKAVALYGGHSFKEEEASLSVTPDIAVATPGRLNDHIARGRIDLRRVTVIVIDEYDKLLELGFEGEMKRIIGQCNRGATIILTSATSIDPLPTWLPIKSPEMIKAEEQTGKKKPVRHVLVESPIPDKLPILIDLLRSLPDGKAIVFVNYRDAATRVHQALKKAGLPAGLYHGALEQSERELALEMFSNTTTPVLVSTDLGSRGLDIDSVESVIHYHLPSSAEAWTHRNGRTGRQDASGDVYVITSENDTVPEYVVTDRPYVPTGISADPIRPHTFTLYFNLGKKEKISKGDIAGFIAKVGGIDGSYIGRITLSDHSSLAAVDLSAGTPDEMVRTLSQQRLKGKKVRVTVVNR
ncbi:MAG: DEAD/DEAH box helicase [Pseudoflavonifractor sp.]|nr:DEAD/DEAH box helicase [Alloprevotella sp.]MCM1117057.1 DEAD/DEAH box helicase [Pseudoflavonifractor sp.]